MLPYGPRHRCAGPLVTMQRNPARSDWALLLRPEQRLKGNCLPEVNVEASRFRAQMCHLMYDAGLTGLIMIPLATLLSLLLFEPGEPVILPSVLMLTGELDRTSTQRGESSQSKPIVLPWPGRAGVDVCVGHCYH